MNIDSATIGSGESMDLKNHTTALAKAHAAFPTIILDAKNPAFSSKYATFQAISEALRPALTSNGFAMPQYQSCLLPNVGWVVRGFLRHDTGECTYAMLPLINNEIVRKDFKTGALVTSPPNMQGLGSALTYAKRLLLLMLTGAWVGEVDDDANAVSNASSPAQASDLPRRAAQKRVTNGMEIESIASKSIDAAVSREAGQKVVDKVKLRVSEKVCGEDVLVRCQKRLSDKFPVEVPKDGE
jgi:hypothetical protein